MLASFDTDRAATGLVSRLRDAADAYSITGEAIPDRTVRILCDGLAAIHRRFAAELQAALGAPRVDCAPAQPDAASATDPVRGLLDRVADLDAQFRAVLRTDLPNDIDLLIYRLYAKVRRARERVVAALMLKPAGPSHFQGVIA
jgi:hypothetical protein